MSSFIWTPDELSSDLQTIDLDAWRIVEAQHKSSTIKLTDSIDDQILLERLIENTKPMVPADCRTLHFLFSTPFRYRPYLQGSRFRESGHTPGVYYCAESSATAVAEIAFYKVLFFAESPDVPWPSNPGEHTAFSAHLKSDKVLDLTGRRFDRDRSALEDLCNYTTCQSIEKAFRAAGGEVIKYRSVRDAQRRSNFAVLQCGVFADPEPTALESWKIHLSRTGVRAVREFPPLSLEFDPAEFDADRRLANMVWDR